MRKRMFTKLAAGMMAAAMVMTSGSVFAADTGTNYSGTIEGTKTTTFDKYLVMDQQAEVPYASFTYEITAGTPKTYELTGNKTFEVLAGVDPKKVTMSGVGTSDPFTISYAYGDATAKDTNSLVKYYDQTIQKYAKKTAVLDFSACAFPEPGIYRYVITESGTNQAITNDREDTTRIVDVYVEDSSDASTKKLKIAGYVLHSNTDDSPAISMGNENGSAGSYTATKAQGFTNEYDTSDLTFRKEVSGNQASHDKYFKFTVTITDAVPNTVYDVDITDANANSGSNSATITENTKKSNPTTLKVGDDGTVTENFYLQHGQEITIQGIAKDSVYSVTENPEDYQSNPAAVALYTAPVSGTIVSTDLQTSYLNKRNGVIPMGVIMAVAPFAAVTLIGGFGTATMIMRKKSKKEDEEKAE